MPAAGRETQSREEVMNVLLAECINESGMSAEAENVERNTLGNRALPDVVVSYQGLRCAVEGKWADVNGAKQTVEGQAKERIETGIAHLALAVMYPVELRSAPLSRKRQMLDEARLNYCLYTEQSVGDWREGNVAGILDDLIRAQHLLATDDIVTHAVAELQEGMFALVSVLTDNPAYCDRLAEILSVYEPEARHEDTE